MAWRRLADRPAEALAAHLPARAPKARLSRARATIRMPQRYTTDRLAASRPRSMRMAVMKGMRISIKTSSAAMAMHRKVSFRYLPSCCNTCFTSWIPPLWNC